MSGTRCLNKILGWVVFFHGRSLQRCCSRKNTSYKQQKSQCFSVINILKLYFSSVNPAHDTAGPDRRIASVHDHGTCFVDADKELLQLGPHPKVRDLENILFSRRTNPILYCRYLPKARSDNAVQRRQKSPVRPAPARQWTTIGWDLLRCCCQK